MQSEHADLLGIKDSSNVTAALIVTAAISKVRNYPTRRLNASYAANGKLIPSQTARA